MAEWDVGTGSLGAILRVTATVAEKDIAGNRSRITGGMDIRNVPGATFTGDPVPASLVGVGATVNTTFTWTAGTSGKDIVVINRWIDHEPDGTLELEITGSIGASGTSGLGGPTTNGPRTLIVPRIPRGPLVEVDGEWVHSIAYVEQDDEWVQALVHVEQDDEWVLTGG